MKYTVKQGDTIAKISTSNGIRPIDLLLANSVIYSEQSYLPVGSKLMIPKRTRAFDHTSNNFDCEFGHSDVEDMLPQLVNAGIRVEIIGHSVMKKPLYAFSIGSGKKEVFYSGGWHGNEWHTSKFLVLFLKELAKYNQKKDKWYQYDVSNILNEIKLYIVPLVNPDGVDLVLQGVHEDHPYYNELLHINKGINRFDHWSSNINGVDLNHQWPARWEKEAKGSPQIPWPRHYSGKSPLTEPEAIAVYEFTCRQSFDYVLAFHSQGQMIYWGYRGMEPKESSIMVEKLSLASSYTPVQTAESDAGYKDWFIQETKRPGFTIEMGTGTNPLPPNAFAEIWSNNLLLALEGLVL